MKKLMFIISIILFLLISLKISLSQRPSTTPCNALNGKLGSSSQWGSGWIDLARLGQFHIGDTLIFTLGGTALRVKVRLLQNLDDPNQTAGVLAPVFTVPQTRIIVVPITSNLADVKQISVHGGQPWDYNLGANNGPVTIINVCLKCRHSQRH